MNPLSENKYRLQTKILGNTSTLIVKHRNNRNTEHAELQQQ